MTTTQQIQALVTDGHIVVTDEEGIYRIPVLDWNDHDGDFLTFTNARLMMADRPDLIAEDSTSFGAARMYSYFITADASADDLTWLTAILQGLEEYPVYDDDRYSEAESEACEAAWLEYGYRDAFADIADYLGKFDPDTDIEEWSDPILLYADIYNGASESPSMDAYDSAAFPYDISIIGDMLLSHWLDAEARHNRDVALWLRAEEEHGYITLV